MATLFCDLPDAQRMRIRDAVDDAFGEVDGYDGECIRVSLPRPVQPFLVAMREAGLERVGDLWCFPLGSDKPADHLRHDGSYPGSKGFWCYGRFKPATVPAEGVPT